MSTSQRIWSPSQDKALQENARNIADIAYQSLFSVIEDRLAGLPDDEAKQQIYNVAFQLQQTIDDFVKGHTAGLIQELETERGMIVLRIRKLHVEVTALNNRSKFLENTIKHADSENLNMAQYGVRKARNSKPSERMRLPGELEQWEEWVAVEESKVQKLQDVLNGHKTEYAEVNRELNDKVQEFNLAQAREAALWSRIQQLKRSPEVLKTRIKSQLLQLEERKAVLRQALVALGAGSLETAGVGLAG